jgi:hypothetical protein
VKNTEDTAVTWEVSDGAGGTIDDTGKYTAPPVPGTYQVVAISKADVAKHAVAKITVTA